MPEGGVAPMSIIKYENSEILLYKHNSEIMILVNDSKRMNFFNLYIHVFKIKKWNHGENKKQTIFFQMFSWYVLTLLSDA